jgi:translation elongation factor EF-1beta
MRKKNETNNKELKVRITTKQMEWLKKQAEENEGNVAFTLRKILTRLMKK